MERLLRNLYGSTPQIDLDRQFARVRVVKPMSLDFAALVDGLKRNNVGYGGATVRVEVEVREGRATFVETGQSLPFEGADAGRAVRVLRILDAAMPARTRAEEAR